MTLDGEGSAVDGSSEISENEGTREEGLPRGITSDELEYVREALTDRLPSEQDVYDTPIFNTEGDVIITENEDAVMVKYHLSDNPTSTEGVIAAPILVNTPEYVINKTLSGEMDYASAEASNDSGELKLEFSYWKDDLGPATDEVVTAIEELDPATTRESYSGR